MVQLNLPSSPSVWMVYLSYYLRAAVVADMIGAAMRSWVQSQLQEIIIFHENFCSDVSSGSTLRYYLR